MPAISGQNAHVKLYTGTTTYEVANLASWSIQMQSGEVPLNVFGTAWGKTQQGLRTWRATVSGFFDPDDSTGQEVLKNAFFQNTLIPKLYFYVDNTHYWCPDLTTDSAAGCRITSYSVNAASDNAVRVEFTVSGSGPITYI